MNTKRTRKTPRNTLNIYDSMGAAAAGLGVTVAFLKWAKSKGAPGFRSTRIFAEEFQPWLEAHRGEMTDDKRALECQLLSEKIKINRVERMKLEGLYTLTSEWESWQIRKAEQLKALMTDIFKRQLPPKLEGLRAAEIVCKMDDAIVEFINKFREPIEGEE